MKTFYQCPDCGFKQRSKARKRIKCHKCGRTYKRKDAKKTRKEPDEKGKGFFRYKKDDS